MKTLNLANPNKSDVKFKVSNFFDGEVNLHIESELDHKIDFNTHFKKLIQPVLAQLTYEAMNTGYNKYRR